MFENLQDGLRSAFKSLSGKGKLTESNMRDGLKIVEQSLLEADVSYSVVQHFMDRVSEIVYVLVLGWGLPAQNFLTLEVLGDPIASTDR